MKRPSCLRWGCLIWAAVLTLQPVQTAFAQTGPPPVDDPGAAILVPAGAVWRYLDDGSPQGDAWRLPDFPDATWKSGPAQLGYGDGDEATVVSYGPSAGAKHITTWFRHGFDVADASHLMHLVLYLVRDDGAVIYLNGHELVRDNLPAGPISSETPASSAVGANENQFHRYDLAASFLITGRNILAVEVHQANPSSSDLSFDLELVAMPPKDEPLPVVSIHASVPETTEPSPTTRVRPGEFTITRTGSTNEPLILFLEYGGTAMLGHDYAEPPPFFTLPQGESALTVRVEPKDDTLVEGDEIVTARLVIPPIDSLPNYHIDPAHYEARVLIHDDEPPGLPEVRVFAEPWRTGEPCPTCLVAPAVLVFQRSAPATDPLVFFLQADGTATAGLDYEALPDRVEFPAGQSELRVNLLARDDQLAEGPEVVRVRLATPLTDGPPTYVISPDAGEALVAIFDDEPGAPEARLDIVEPVDGSQFPIGSVIRLSAIGVYTQGEIQQPVQFYAGDRLIGQTTGFPFARPPIPGFPGVHTISWTNPPPGSHVLTARTELALDRWLTSPPVSITVGPLPGPTLVSIATEDQVATETDLITVINPARFRITRTGDVTRDLLVFYSVHGSATPGLDYPELPGSLLLPVGESSATFDIVARPDELHEGMETIYIRLEPSPLMGPLPTYEISAARDDVAIILDNSFDSSPAVEIVWPKEGDRFTQPTNLEIVAAAYHPTLDMFRVDFYAGDTKIGDSWITFDRLFSGGLIVHRFNWSNPPGGVHTLTAHAFAESDATLPPVVSPPVHITVERGPVLPIIRIEATGRIAEETSDPLERLRLVGEFTVSRGGPTDEPLSVFVHYSGTATSGVDYPHLPWSVTIPQGATSTTIRVEPIPDDVREGIETLVATLSDCPPETDPPLGMPCVGGFQIDPAQGQATVFIRDDGVTQASLAILRPQEGAAFKLGDTILIEAVAIALDGYLPRVEFWDGDQRIGVSEIVFIRAPDPGTPIFHTFEWHGASAGPHGLTARVPLADGTMLESVPVHIRVEAEPLPAVVRIEATQRIAEESSEPLRRIAFVGEFTIARTGPTDQPLSVFVHYSGLATPGVDYPLPPWLVTIPAGAASATIRVEPIPDHVPEGIETLVAVLSHCPPETDPPLGMPCVGGFDIDPAQEQATVFIRDDGITEASVSIRRPAEGAVFRAGQTIPIQAIAIDLESYISRVEFWDGDRQIGVSAIDFFRAPDPGTPIEHWFEWRDASSGAHLLTARARRDDGTPVMSAPVHITVGPVVSQPPHLAITRPTAGAQLPLGTPIEIVAEALDPDGYVPLVEFFADGRKLGERRIVFIHPPDPGQPQTFTFVWREPTPGPHVLTARATDDQGDTGWSAPVGIRVTTLDLLPIVRVTARDPWSVEPQSNTVLNTATFRIRRFGPTNAPLAVAYSLHGTAVNGVDYEPLSGAATIPAGRHSVDVILRPLADALTEWIETAVLRLEDPASTELPTYRVGFPRRAVALISDHPQFHPAAQTRCFGLPDGLLSVGFGAETGNAFRVEGSTDLRNWETVSEALAVDGVVYFVDDEVGSFARRFYRLVPDPFLKMDE